MWVTVRQSGGEGEGWGGVGPTMWVAVRQSVGEGEGWGGDRPTMWITVWLSFRWV